MTTYIYKIVESWNMEGRNGARNTLATWTANGWEPVTAALGHGGYMIWTFRKPA